MGNGHFATTVDVTGLQSYVDDYKNGIPLNAMSDWGWHSFPNKENLKEEESQKAYDFGHPNKENLKEEESQKAYDFGHGHPEVYAIEYKKAEDGRHKQATEYFRVNPHRLNLGAVGLDLKDANGNAIALSKLTDINQKLNLWQGEITSNYKADGEKVNVVMLLPLAYLIVMPLPIASALLY